MRFALMSLFVALALPAAAAERTPVAVPAAVLAVVDSAAPKSDLPTWTKALAHYAPTAVMPGLDKLPPFLGSLVGAPTLDGLDFARPIHLVVLNPAAYPHPLLLVGVRDLKALKASVKAAKLSVVVVGKYALVGDEAAITTAGDVAKARVAILPKQGIHGTIYVQTIWSAFGTLAKTIISAQIATKPAPPAPGKPAPPQVISPEMATTLANQLYSMLDQSDLVTIDLTGSAAGVGLTVALDVKPGSPLDTVFSAQHASDFALIGKLPNQPSSMLTVGVFDPATLGDWMFDVFVGNAKNKLNEQQRAQWHEFIAVSTGEIAMAMNMDATGQAGNSHSLIGSRDTKRMNELFPTVSALFDTGGFGGLFKIARKPLKPVTYDELTISGQQIAYDYTHTTVPAYKGPKTMTRDLRWTTFEGYAATTLGAPGNDTIDALLDSARHGKDTLQLDAATKAGLDEARALKDSLWMRIDMSKLAATTPGMPLLVPTAGIGFAPHHVRLRMQF